MSVNSPIFLKRFSFLGMLEIYGSIPEMCLQLFGCKGKATIEAFQCAKEDAWKWAAALAYGKPDLVQKYLALKKCIRFEPSAVSFLESLGDNPALRMVKTTTYKIDGRSRYVQGYLVYCTGSWWNQIRNKPVLGRVRCWQATHDLLYRHFLSEQPDDILLNDERWLPVDGLCAVDGSWQLELPSWTSTLRSWGEQLHNCLAFYAADIDARSCVVFAVKVDGKVKYAVEMKPAKRQRGLWYCTQFSGDRGEEPCPDLKYKVLLALHQAGLSSSSFVAECGSIVDFVLIAQHRGL